MKAWPIIALSILMACTNQPAEPTKPVRQVPLCADYSITPEQVICLAGNWRM